jgi:3-oxoadipate enol-lactonase / 4-carboxymuconolactone decarboxylase
MRQTEILARITAPTLVIIGDKDQSTPADPHGNTLAREIRTAKVEHLPSTHLSPVECPRSFSTLLMRLLVPSDSDALRAGFQRRREVLGNDHVDRAIANTTSFNAAFQQLITCFAWGHIWRDPALDDRTRRLLVLTATAALGRWEEFRLHVRTGLSHGLEPCDIEQTLLQVAAYTGIPAANTGFHIADEEISRT